MKRISLISIMIIVLITILIIVAVIIGSLTFNFFKKNESPKVENLVSKQEVWILKIEDISTENLSNSLIIYEDYKYSIINGKDNSIIEENTLNYNKSLDKLVDSIKSYAKEDIDNGINYKVTFKDNTYKYVSIKNTTDVQELINSVSKENIFLVKE